MHLLDGGIARLLGCTNLFGVVATPTYFDSQGIVGDGAIDVYSNIEFHQVALLKNHLALEPLRRIQQAVSRVVRSHVID